MNEVAGGNRCPACDTLNVALAAYCSGCGSALGRTFNQLQALQAAGNGATQPMVGQYAPQVNPPQMMQPYQDYTQPLQPYGASYGPAQTYQQPYAPPPQQYGQGYAPAPMQGYEPPYAPAYPQGYEPPYPANQESRPNIQGYYPSQHAPISINVSPVVNVYAPPSMMAPQPAPVVVVNTTQPGVNLVVRALWFLFVGLWLGLIATVVGWALCIGVLTLPLGLLLLNRLPAIMTLQARSTSTQVIYANGVTAISTNVVAPQLSMVLRGVYFVFVGWWLSAIWLVLAWCLVVLSIPTLGLTLAPAFMMFNRVPQVLTLRVN